jgi:hypothetical protein
MRRKKQKPPICIGGSEKLRAMDRPRYMNVPSPAPCHVNVAGVGKQSVWGLRIIAGTQLLLWHHSANSSIPKSGRHRAFWRLKLLLDAIEPLIGFVIQP